MAAAGLSIRELDWGHPLPGGEWRQLFRDFSLDCPRGQFVVVIGSNGSGKSTLLNLVAGTLKATAGSIRLGERPLERLPDHGRARWIGRVMQNPLDGTCPTLSIAENLRLAERRHRPALSLQGLLGLHPSPGDRRRYRSLLAGLGLPLADRLDEPVGQLSGGQRQTLSLVMATLGSPDLLLLDEHTAALDPRAEATVIGLTEQLVRQLGTTTLMVTHSLKQALSHGDRLVMLHDGQLIGDWDGEQRRSLSEESLRALYGSAIVKSTS
ncbi:ATP-binding cassette domain-containing protein [Cyanobium sp. HWJ4-Hawea]|uniref:ABC transporter ATP-binding protein n=1 Tax=Cyanobium sp. HWJ4-Hawea TaxID=2823713 RepID=UPI0020CBEF8B|nr:ATP-binding cassette domain-containing protein [Cyanobium sp. HWJ4-Hawea]MCP9809181.1 ATP-binding cassette domain-containing protein [Cyanobium sp. HWJ4-Hawea]